MDKRKLQNGGEFPQKTFCETALKTIFYFYFFFFVIMKCLIYAPSFYLSLTLKSLCQ